MFREMRRKRQLLPPEESVAILERMTTEHWPSTETMIIHMQFLSVMCISMAGYIFTVP